MPITTISLLWHSNIWCSEEFPEILNANPSALVENIICYHLFDKTLLVKSGWGRCTLFNHPTLSVETQHDTFQAKWTWSLTQLLNMFDSSNHSNNNTVYQWWQHFIKYDWQHTWKHYPLDFRVNCTEERRHAQVVDEIVFQTLWLLDSSTQLAPPWIPSYALHTSKGHQIHCLLLDPALFTSRVVCWDFLLRTIFCHLAITVQINISASLHINI